jgi:hypothetical protein
MRLKLRNYRTRIISVAAMCCKLNNATDISLSVTLCSNCTSETHDRRPLGVISADAISMDGWKWPQVSPRSLMHADNIAETVDYSMFLDAQYPAETSRQC